MSNNDPVEALQGMLSSLRRSRTQHERLREHLSTEDYIERCEITVSALFLAQEMLLAERLMELHAADIDIVEMLDLAKRSAEQIERLHANGIKHEAVLKATSSQGD